MRMAGCVVVLEHPDGHDAAGRDRNVLGHFRGGRGSVDDSPAADQQVDVQPVASVFATTRPARTVRRGTSIRSPATRSPTTSSNSNEPRASS